MVQGITASFRSASGQRQTVNSHDFIPPNPCRHPQSSPGLQWHYPLLKIRPLDHSGRGSILIIFSAEYLIGPLHALPAVPTLEMNVIFCNSAARLIISSYVCVKNLKSREEKDCMKHGVLNNTGF
jgi:hypothetical protein